MWRGVTRASATIRTTLLPTQAVSCTASDLRTWRTAEVRNKMDMRLKANRDDARAVRSLMKASPSREKLHLQMVSRLTPMLATAVTHADEGRERHTKT